MSPRTTIQPKETKNLYIHGISPCTKSVGLL